MHLCKPAFFCFLLAISLFPAISRAEYNKDQYQYAPSIEEMYLDCKQAVDKADHGDLKAFYDSSCGARMNALVITLFYALHYIPVLSENASEQEKHDANIKENTIKSIASRFCGVISLKGSKSKEPPEVGLARNYIASVETSLKSKAFNASFKDHHPFNLRHFFNYECKTDAE